MPVTDYPLIQSWLSQFDVPDRFVAQYMLERLRYVSFQEFESSLQTQVLSLINHIGSTYGSQPIALFPITKSSVNNFNAHKEPKSPYDSSGRIGHSLRNLERDLPSYVEVSPRLESMKSRKVRHIVLIDDMIGSGNRIRNYWNKTVSREIKSWSSLQWCMVWVVTHSAHARGIHRITSSIRSISPERVRSCLTIDKPFFEYQTSVQRLLQRYEQRYLPAGFSTGYSSLMFPVIFQHGCPNNAPGLLWYKCTRKQGRGWTALFPNRQVPKDLYPLFEEPLRPALTEEELWTVGRYTAALNFIEREQYFKGSRLTLITLAHISRGYSIDKIRSLLVASNGEITGSIDELMAAGLLSETFEVTPFGKEFLRRLGRRRYGVRQSTSHSKEWAFYPSSFMGFQRDV